MANIELDKFFPNDIKRLILLYNLPVINKEKFSDALEDIKYLDCCEYFLASGCDNENKVSKTSPIRYCSDCAILEYNQEWWNSDFTENELFYESHYIAYQFMLKPKYFILDKLHTELIKYFMKRDGFQCRTFYGSDLWKKRYTERQK